MAYAMICAGLSVLCILFAHAGFGNSIVLLSGEDDLSDLHNILHRVRRQANESEEEHDANTKCVIRNLKDIESKLQKALPPEKNVSKAAALAKPHQIFSNADPATLVKFCAIYKASRTRLAGCGESQMKTFAARALAVVDFVCIDRYNDFISAFPCIQTVDDLTDDICQKNCSEYESAAEKLNNAGAAIVRKYKPSEIKELFAQSCLYVMCYMDCQKPMLQDKCGAKVLELEMASIGVTFKNLDDMMDQSSASNLWPRECRPLSAMGQHTDKNATSAPIRSLPVGSSGNATHDNTTANAPAVQPAVVPATTVITPAASNWSLPDVTAAPQVKITSETVAGISVTPGAVTAEHAVSKSGNNTARARQRSRKYKN